MRYTDLMGDAPPVVPDMETGHVGFWDGDWDDEPVEEQLEAIASGLYALQHVGLKHNTLVVGFYIYDTVLGVGLDTLWDFIPVVEVGEDGLLDEEAAARGYGRIAGA
jgi:hypothetical protein